MSFFNTKPKTYEVVYRPKESRLPYVITIEAMSRRVASQIFMCKYPSNEILTVLGPIEKV